MWALVPRGPPGRPAVGGLAAANAASTAASAVELIHDSPPIKMGSVPGTVRVRGVGPGVVCAAAKQAHSDRAT